MLEASFSWPKCSAGAEVAEKRVEQMKKQIEPGDHWIGPDFFIVGAPKSATTALWAYLRMHPQIFMPDQKELHYFGSDLGFGPPGKNFEDIPRSKQDEKKYLGYFKNASEGQIVGEASVWYLYSSVAAEEIRRFNQNAKIIIMLRNPIEMVYSMHSQFLWERNEDVQDFATALAKEANRRNGIGLPKCVHFAKGLQYSDIAKFTEQVSRYFETFPEEQVHVIIFDDFKKDPDRAYINVLKFLGVSLDSCAKYERVNENKNLRSTALQEMLMSPKGGVRKLGRIIPQKYRSDIFKWLMENNTTYGPRRSLPEGARQALLNIYVKDIESLERLLKADLGAWKK
jgi:hypothetical protein